MQGNLIWHERLDDGSHAASSTYLAQFKALWLTVSRPGPDLKSTVLRDLDWQTFHKQQHVPRVPMQHIIAL
jgi:hypothetical protein